MGKCLRSWYVWGVGGEGGGLSCVQVVHILMQLVGSGARQVGTPWLRMNEKDVNLLTLDLCAASKPCNNAGWGDERLRYRNHENLGETTLGG